MRRTGAQLAPPGHFHYTVGMKSESKLAGGARKAGGAGRNERAPRSSATVSRAIPPLAKVAEVILEADALNARLLTGHQLSIREANGEVVRCDVVGTGELVAPEMFDDYLARGLIQEMEHSYRFGISNDGRRRLR
jgi:hypothetical protein